MSERMPKTLEERLSAFERPVLIGTGGNTGEIYHYPSKEDHGITSICPTEPQNPRIIQLSFAQRRRNCRVCQVCLEGEGGHRYDDEKDA